SLDVIGARFVARHLVASSPGASLVQGTTGYSVKGPKPTSAVVDAVVEVAPDSAPIVRVRKGYDGEATGTVERRNAVPTVVTTLIDTRHDGDYIVTESVTPAALVGEGLTVPQVDPRRLVLAFYYPWFTEKTFQQKTVWADRPDGPYRTDDAGDVHAMVAQAAANGIDGFISAWGGSPDDEQRADLLYQAALDQGNFFVVPHLEVGILADQGGDLAVEQAGRAALARATHPAYLRTGGLPVLMVYSARTIGAVRWTAIRQQLEATAGPLFVVGDDRDPAYGFDGFHLYNPNSMDASQLSKYDKAAAEELRMPAQVDPTVKQRLWMGTVSPGMNTMLGPFGTYRSRDGGQRYDQTWSAALASAPEWIAVTSWNEWYESTHVSLSKNAGGRALAQTQWWSAQF
ncbi:MAG: hypothetical protein QOJ09_2802, partial [Actinomycetota bacterium]|nr:hypothetical protein [Actinomycetota bacterium]